MRAIQVFEIQVDWDAAPGNVGTWHLEVFILGPNEADNFPVFYIIQL